MHRLRPNEEKLCVEVNILCLLQAKWNLRVHMGSEEEK